MRCYFSQLWDAFYKEKEPDYEHSKWLYRSETFYLKFSQLFVYPRLICSNVLSHPLFSMLRYPTHYNLHLIIGSFSNHDDDGKKPPTNLHIWQW